jgi:hypothetical protein
MNLVGRVPQLLRALIAPALAKDATKNRHRRKGQLGEQANSLVD